MNPGQKTVKPRPPDKGSFPLDHMGECKEYMQAYMACLKSSGSDNHKCRRQCKQYLECRMKKNLMANEEFVKLGFQDDKID
eukprot:m.61655 g.61655  ORF g.61655 m.61655 type:complete len:81 (+) comp35016_c0_seq1:205-447(+)